MSAAAMAAPPTETLPALVIGAGPSGLAVAQSLGAQGIRATVLEARDAVGSSWRGHYDRLHLHTVKQHSALPGMPFDDTVANYPSRAEVVAYLDAYAKRFDLDVRFGQRVVRAWREGDGWSVETSAGTLRAKALVVATGYNRAPKEPSWPGQESFAGEVIHASRYRNGAAWRGRRALVVGVGNTGAEIALDLWEHGAKVTLCARSPQHVVPRDVLGIPAQVNSLLVFSRIPVAVADRVLGVLSRALVGDLSRYGLRTPRSGIVSDVVKRGHIPLIDIGTVGLIKQGAITVVPGLARFTEEGVVCEDGRAVACDVVVLATGYRAALDEFLDDAAALTDARGYPRWHGAEVPGRPGLYFIGYRNPLTGALHDIAREAVRVAASIARSR